MRQRETEREREREREKEKEREEDVVTDISSLLVFTETSSRNYHKIELLLFCAGFVCREAVVERESCVLPNHEKMKMSHLTVVVQIAETHLGTGNWASALTQLSFVLNEALPDVVREAVTEKVGHQYTVEVGSDDCRSITGELGGKFKIIEIF